jgi:hypothetical protein
MQSSVCFKESVTFQTCDDVEIREHVHWTFMFYACSKVFGCAN